MDEISKNTESKTTNVSLQESKIRETRLFQNKNKTKIKHKTDLDGATVPHVASLRLGARHELFCVLENFLFDLQEIRRIVPVGRRSYRL